MIIPVRCFSCGKPIGRLWADYQKKLESGKSKKEAMEELGLERLCCKQAFMGHVDNLDLSSEFKKF